MKTTFKQTMKQWQMICRRDVVRFERNEHDNRSTLSEGAGFA